MKKLLLVPLLLTLSFGFGNVFAYEGYYGGHGGYGGYYGGHGYGDYGGYGGYYGGHGYGDYGGYYGGSSLVSEVVHHLFTPNVYYTLPAPVYYPDYAIPRRYSSAGVAPSERPVIIILKEGPQTTHHCPTGNTKN